MNQNINWLAGEEAKDAATKLRKELKPLVENYRKKIFAQRASPSQVFYFPSFMANLLLEDTNKERKYLYEVAKRWNSQRRNRHEWLIAHGNARGGAESLCQILIEGELKHYLHHENYGSLGNDNAHFGGHWDKGWGLFVTTNEIIGKRRVLADISSNIFTVPLGLVKAIVLPTPAVNIVGNLFPNYSKIIKGYAQYAEDLSMN